MSIQKVNNAKNNQSNALFKRFLSNNITPYIIAFCYSVFFIVLSYHVIARQDSDISFHMARITGLAQSIRNFDFLPNLNYVLGNGVGYAVPMFYGQWLLYPSAVVFVLTKSIKISYALYALLITLGNTFGNYYVFNKITKKRETSLLIALFVPLIYSNFGYGMTAVTPLIPFLFLGFYEILFENKNTSLILGATVALLIQTHIISSLVLGMTFIIFTLFNYQQLTFKKILYFIESLVIAIFLSIGFIFQYIEQTRSQVFYATWTTRPFMGMGELSRSVREILLNMFQTDTSVTSIANYPVLIVVVTGIFLYLLLKWDTLSTISQSILAVYLVLIIFSSNVLPWNDLRFSILGVFQWTGRILTFCSSLVCFALLFENKKLKPLIILLLTSLAMYTSMIVLRYNDDAKTFANTKTIEYRNAYYGAQNIDGFSGMEYLTIDITNVSRDQQIPNSKNYFNKFDTKTESYSIKNVRKEYNSLEFDIKLKNKSAAVVLPKIWYKGYVAEYSDGAKGTQPSQETISLSKSDILSNKKAHKPYTTKRVLNDGKAVINVNQSGHVKISYQKTSSQKLGYILEAIFWIVTLTFGLFKIHRKKDNKYTKTNHSFNS